MVLAPLQPNLRISRLEIRLAAAVRSSGLGQCGPGPARSVDHSLRQRESEPNRWLGARAGEALGPVVGMEVVRCRKVRAWKAIGVSELAARIRSIVPHRTAFLKNRLRRHSSLGLESDPLGTL